MTSRDELADAIVVDLPLRGEWVAGTTPAERIPSHGTDVLAQRYAFDFVRMDRRRRLYPGGSLRAAILGVPIQRVYGWGAPVHAPFDATVVAVHDGVPESRRVFLLAVVARVLRNTITFRPDQPFARLAGNHVIVRSGDVYAAFAHLTPGSIPVTPGQALARGAVIGRVGHTGNSTAPHLHVQLMDGPDPRTARALPCAFAAYEIERDDGTWRRVERGIPGKEERIRSVSSS
jgi:hypothetical protein